MRVLGVVPARGGSKGIPRKNIRRLAGKPLLQYTAEAALGAKSLERTLLTTDDVEIAEFGRDLGMWVPFMRPPELAEDDTPTLPVLLHVVEWLIAEGEDYDAYCLLQPTAPLRTSRDIEEAIALLANSNSDSVISVIPVPWHYHAGWQLRQDEEGNLRLWNGDSLNQIAGQRQLLPPTFIRSGDLYVLRHSTLVVKRSLYGDRCFAYLMPSDRHVNIDTFDDWEQAERLLLGRGI